MRRDIHSNNAVGFLAAAIDSTQTTILLQTGNGALFPDVRGDDEDGFWITIEDRTVNTMEICYCTAREVDSLTVIRAQQDTVGTAFLLGTAVSNRVTAEFLNEFYDSIAAAGESAEAAAIAAAAAVVAAADAKSTANAAQSTADAAYEGISVAVDQSTEALDKANDALGMSTDVYSLANTALTNSSSAVNTANAAATTASDAQSAAADAYNLAAAAAPASSLGSAAYRPETYFVTRTEYDAWKLLVTGQINDLFNRVAALEDGTDPPDPGGVVLEAGILVDGIVE